MWASHVLLKAFCAADLLKDKSTLGEVARLLWGIYMGPQVTVPFTRLPSTSTLRRTALAVDGAIMLVRRCESEAERGSTRPVRKYAWADASPQATREWLLSQHLRVAGDMIVEVAPAVACHCLKRQQQQLREEEEEEHAAVEAEPPPPCGT